MSTEQPRARGCKRKTSNSEVPTENVIVPIDTIDLTVESPVNKVYREGKLRDIRRLTINLDDTNILEKSINPGRPHCPICYEKLEDSLEPTATRCGHVYCKPCLTMCLKHKKSCPTCKRCISEKSCIRLYFAA